MFAARKEKGTMIFFETSWVVIIIIMVITIKDWRKNRKANEPKVTDEEMEKFRKGEVDKFHKWWNENMAAKYGGYFDEKGDDGKDA